MSIYIEVEGLNGAVDDSLQAEVDSRSASLLVALPGKRKRRFALTNLYADVASVQIEVKKSKHMVVLRLLKKQEASWPKLQHSRQPKWCSPRGL